MRLRAPNVRPSVTLQYCSVTYELVMSWRIQGRRIQGVGRLSRRSADWRFCLPRARHSPPDRELRIKGLLRRIHPSVREWPGRSGITVAALSAPSGRGSGITGRRQAKAVSMFRRRHRAMCITPTPTMFPGITPIGCRRMSYPRQDRTCRIAPRRRSPFRGMRAPTRPRMSISRGATRARSRRLAFKDSLRVVPANAGTHNPCRQKYKKVSAPALKR